MDGKATMTTKTEPAINPKYRRAFVLIAIVVVAIATIRLYSWADEQAKAADWQAKTAAADAEVAKMPWLDNIQCKVIGYQDFDLLPSQRRELTSVGSLDSSWDQKDGAITACGAYKDGASTAADAPDLENLAHVDTPAGAAP